ncbi:hypothetical protein [Chitinimonas naiadis]
MPNLTDIDHYLGSDISASVTGDLQPCTGIARGKQRILRRLLTNPGDYPFHPDYGAGLGLWIGQLADIPAIQEQIRTQMQAEETVAATPPPDVGVVAIPNGLQVSIRYTDKPSGQPAMLNFNVNR